MGTTHVGKIGRLSKSVRDDLGRRIEDGIPGKELVKWLNSLPSVKTVLQAQFEGRDITAQNLSEWRQGGHPDWLRHQETRGFVQHLHEKAGDLKSYNEDGEWFTELDTGESLALVLEAELARETVALLEKTDNPQEKMRLLLKVHHALGQLRRHNHRAARLQRDKLLWQRAEEKREKYAEGAEIRKLKNDLLSPIFAQMEVNSLASTFGGGEAGRKIAEFFVEVHRELPRGSLSGRQPEKTVKSEPARSDLIQPNPTKNKTESNHRELSENMKSQTFSPVTSLRLTPV